MSLPGSARCIVQLLGIAVIVLTALPGGRSPERAAAHAGNIDVVIDCDVLQAGIQTACTVNAGTLALYVDVLITNETASSTTIGSMNFRLNNTSIARLDPLPVSDPSPSLDDNPDFADLSGSWACTPPAPDEDTGAGPVGGTQSFLSCFSAGNGPVLPNTGVPTRLARVRYNVPASAPAGAATLTLANVNVFDNGIFEIHSCNPVVTTAGLCHGATVTVVQPPSVQAFGAEGGGSHTCAVTSASGAVCWGGNSDGQLGNGTNTSRTTAQQVSTLGPGSGVTQVVAGDNHSCAVVSGGARCWGDNASGQLGDASNTDRTTPVTPVGLGSGVSLLAAGSDFTCAVLTTGAVQCWGNGASGRLGNGGVGSSNVPVAVSGIASGAHRIAAGAAHACVRTLTSDLRCWGENGLGQLGDGTTTDRTSPVTILSGTVSLVTAGFAHTCVITLLGTYHCWGDNANGQLGDGTTTSTTSPGVSPGTAQGIAAGAAHTCISRSGGILCFGFNLTGQLGDGTITDRHSETAVIGLGSGHSGVSAGSAHSCAINSTTFGLKCWGNNFAGAVGNHRIVSISVPANVAKLGGNDTDDDDDTCSDATEQANGAVPEEPNNPWDSLDFPNIDQLGGSVAFGDFVGLLAAWNSVPASGNWNPNADLDFNDAVGFSDFVQVLAAWNRLC